jgi:hypothetical protein
MFMGRQSSMDGGEMAKGEPNPKSVAAPIRSRTRPPKPPEGQRHRAPEEVTKVTQPDE